MSAPTGSELRIPADPAFIVVAKRAAAGFGCVAGFDVESVEDLVIAVAQATETAIAAAVRNSGPGGGQVRLVFKLEDRSLEVQVRSLCGRGEDAGECAEQPAAAAPPMSRTARQASAQLADAAAAHDLALRVMGLFVDDYRYGVDQRTGGLRVRLTKYRVG